ncbi:MAG: helix-turn-helix domain-containing protein [Thermoguttaceae bacterium]|nr:helix-turn-helix domain-containing protein [Thermoguttaceae bacterium]
MEIMNMEQVALFLGVSKETVRKMVAEEGLPHRRVGERWLFGRRAIVAWVNGEK